MYIVASGISLQIGYLWDMAPPKMRQVMALPVLFGRIETVNFFGEVRVFGGWLNPNDSLGYICGVSIHIYIYIIYI